MAANSVRMSSFEEFLKRRWLGHHWNKKYELEYRNHVYVVPDYKNHCKGLIFIIYFFKHSQKQMFHLQDIIIDQRI